MSDLKLSCLSRYIRQLLFKKGDVFTQAQYTKKYNSHWLAKSKYCNPTLPPLPTRENYLNSHMTQTLISWLTWRFILFYFILWFLCDIDIMSNFCVVLMQRYLNLCHTSTFRKSITHNNGNIAIIFSIDIFFHKFYLR